MSAGSPRLPMVVALGALALWVAGGGCGSDAAPPGGGDDLSMAPDDLAASRLDLVVPARCDDGEKNGVESDVDCGGPLCDKCPNGRRCASVFDCKSGLCTDGRCVGPSCNDHIKNGSETGVDCGGSCGTGCRAGEGCRRDDDCRDGRCEGFLCAPPGCGDGRKNGSETDVDCGGGACVRCGRGLGCAIDSDCVTELCDADKRTCIACNDGAKNGAETDVDCGGKACAPCAGGGKCLVDRDCKSRLCQAGVCVACQQDLDCQFKVCTAGVCNALELVGTLNGQEYYKVQVMGAMTDTNVFGACMAAGQRTPCQSQGKCQYNDQLCAPTMENGCGSPMLALAKVLCIGGTPPNCKPLDGVYQYMGHNWVMDSACGVEANQWCVQGAGTMDRWALCTP